MPYGQSPWADASASIPGAIEQAGQNMNHVALQVARMRFQQAAQQQRQAIALGQQALRQELANSTMARNQATMGKATADTEMTQQRMKAADQVGDATWAQFMPKVGEQPGAIAGMDVGAASNLARLASAAERSRALFGRGVDPFAMHNVPPGDTAVNPFGQTMAVGQDKLQFGPAGSTPFNAGVQAGPQMGFRPGTGGNDMASMLKFIEMGTAKDPLTGTPTHPEIQSMPAFTNIMNAVNQRFASTNPPPVMLPSQTNASGNAPASNDGQPPMTAVNKKTGQRLVSKDGGQTWQPLQ